MLSFLREQTSDNNEKPQQQPEPPKEQSGASEEFLTVSSNPKQVKKTTKVLAVLFGRGFLCLFLMIKSSTPERASAKEKAAQKAEQQKLEIAMARLTGERAELFNRTDQLLQKFNELSQIEQVKVNELVKNPFAAEDFIGNLTDKFGQNDKEKDTSSELVRRQRLMEQSKELQLLSIMDSPKGLCCMINDKILHKGDTIKEFTITGIDNKSVELTSQGIKINLKFAD